MAERTVDVLKEILERWTEASSALYEGSGEGDVLGLVLRGAKAVGFDRVRLYLISEDGQHLVGRAQVGMDVPFEGLSWPVADDDKMQLLLREARPRVFPQQAGELPPREIRLGKQGVREWASAPVLLREKVIGNLSADNKYSGRPITEQELALLALFASQAAAVVVALENARLIVRDQEKLKLLRKLTEVTREIVGSLGAITLDEHLTLIARRAAELLEAEACEVLLVKREGYLSLEASYGHREGGFHRGREFAIVSGPNTGLTGHLARVGRPFRAHGDALTTHFTVRGVEADHSPSGRCCSLLAAPLKKEERLVGLLRADNKRGADGRPSPSVGFSEEDEWVLQIFAEAIVVALESAGRMAQLNLQNELLVEQTGYLSRLVESSPTGVVVIDRHGAVTDFNRQAEWFFGYPPEALRDRPVYDLYADRLEPRHVNRMLRNSAEGRVAGYETFALNRDGTRIPIRLAAAWLFDAKGECSGSVGYFEDLRPVKEKVRQLKKLLEATNIIARAQDLTDGLQRLAKMMAEYLDASFCRIFLLDEGGQHLVAKAAHATEHAKAGARWTAGLGEPTPVDDWENLRDTLERGDPAVLRIGGKRSKYVLEEWSRRLGLAREIQSLLILPLRTEERTLGLLDMGDIRDWEQSPFTEEKKELAAAIADQIAVLIARVSLHESTERRMQQLVALDERLPHLRGDKEPERLLQEFVRLATELARCRVGGLYINHPQLKELVLSVTHRLPEELVGSRTPHSEGLMGRVARTGEPEVVHRFGARADREAALERLDLGTVIALPLKPSGEVDAVLFVADEQEVEPDLPILQRFVDQAAVALQTARIMSLEQRAVSQKLIWHQISHYTLVAEDLDKVLHVVLTGITAGYGLGFNRAVILLLDEQGEHLIGRMGIGQQSEEEARQAWEYDHEQGLYDFASYLERLQRDDVPPTAVGRVSRALRLPVGADAEDIFSRAVRGRGKLLVEADQLGELPEGFRAAFEPTSPVVVVPLTARDRVIGLLVADNKFTLSPITDETVESLLTYAATAAVAIDKDRLRERFLALNRASVVLVPSQDLERVLQDIVEQTRVAANASWVSMILIDEAGHARKLITSGTEKTFDPAEVIRPNGISMRVMETGEPEVIEDAGAEEHASRVNPSMFRDGSAAALCLPLPLPGKRIGVMWVHYSRPRDFPQFEVDALQLYVNHAAITYDSARRLGELEQMRREAEALARASGSQEVLGQIARGAREVLQADSAVILSYDAAHEKFILESSAAEGIPEDVWEQFRQEVPHSSQTAHTVMDSLWAGVDDLGDGRHAEFPGEATRRLLDRIGARAFQGTALKAGDEQLGVLYMIYNRPRGISPEERQTAQTFANHAALALKQTRLADERDKKLREQEALVKLSKQLLESASLRQTSHRALTVAMDVLGADVGNVILTNPAGELVFAAEVGWEGVEVGESKVSGGNESLTGFTLMEKRPVRVDDYKAERRFKVLAVIHDNQLASGLSVPMFTGEEEDDDRERSPRLVGAMAVHTKTPRHFTDAEESLLQLIANQTAIALKNAQQEKQSARLRALNEASKAITRSSLGLSREQTLNQIVKQAVECIVDRRGGPKAYLGTVQLYNEATNELVFESAHFPPELTNLKERIGDPRVLDRARCPRIGITGRAVLERLPQLVHDVAQDPDYLQITDRIRSELTVPLFCGDKVEGVINLESERPAAFDEDDLETLQAIAELAVIAIQNARSYERLEQTKGLVGARTALAWMGMSSSIWRHAVWKDASTIREQARLLNDDLEDQPVAETIRGAKDRVTMIGSLASRLLEKQTYAKLPAEESGSSLPVNQTVRDRISRLWQSEPYKSVGLDFELRLPETARVRASQDWLHCVLDIIVDNAVEAVAGSERKQIKVTTAPAERHAEIAISDTGPGIPENVRDKLLREPIPKDSSEKGMGAGLLMAHAVIQSYGGELRVAETGPGGTTVVIELPLETQSAGRPQDGGGGAS